MIIKPDYIFNDVYEIDFEQLKKDGIEALLFDLDSTVMPSKSGIFPKEVLQLFEKLKKDFKLAIVTNNKNPQYIKKAQNQIDFEVIANAKKPETKAIIKCLNSFPIPPRHAAMIGDRPLTDILAGKFAGMKTVMVDSITRNTEHKIIRFVRAFEKLTVKR